MLVILLYRVIGSIRVMTLHLGVVNGGSVMVDRAWGHVHDMTVRIRCPGDLGEIYVHSFVYMHLEMFRLLCMMWGDVI